MFRLAPRIFPLKQKYSDISRSVEAMDEVLPDGTDSRCGLTETCVLTTSHSQHCLGEEGFSALRGVSENPWKRACLQSSPSLPQERLVGIKCFGLPRSSTLRLDFRGARAYSSPDF